MKRKTFDALLATGGVVLAFVLAVAGTLGLWAHHFANQNVHNQLAQQQIFFPTQAEFAAAKAGTEITPAMLPYLQKYAGQQLTTGAQAEAYANHFIAEHLAAMPYGGVYAKVSAASRANPTDAALAAEVDTTFKGTTLRGLLLEAYGYGKMGQIAGVAALVSFIGAGVMLLLSAFGFRHLRRVSPEAEVLPKMGARTPAPVER